MLSRYRIGGKLGAGGMGVVYRAEDISLHRPVALKFLSGTSLSQEQTRARFLREARTAAALNHPNVCTIHEVGEVESGEEAALGTGGRLDPGTPFIAMEMIDGQTLEAMVRQSGSLPFDDLLGIALQVADGMAAAHAQGIVHRDLKPGNVMVTKEGRVKILDFGLAKPLEPAEPGDAAGTAAETASAELTREGRVIGTAAYMSPEQAKGEHVDSRSDVFSFGVMLYELATGTRPFRGTTTISTLAKIIEEEPEPIPDARTDIPQELRRILRRCLQKRPENRYNDTRDLVAALKALRQETTSGAPKMASGAGAAAPSRARRHVPWFAAAALVLAGLVAAGFWLAAHRGEPKREPVLRQITGNTSENPLLFAEISPDGKRLLYKDRAGFFVRAIDGGENQPLRLPEVFDVYFATWSPADPTGLLLMARRSKQEPYNIWSFSLLGGAPRQVLESFWAEFWPSPDGQWLLYRPAGWGQAAAGEIWIAGPRGEAPRRIATAGGDTWFLSVAWSPDSRRFADVRGGLQNKKWSCFLETRDLAGGDVQEIVSDENLGSATGLAPLSWLADGRIVYARSESPPSQNDSNLWEVSVDPSTGKRAGAPRRITHWSNERVFGLSAAAGGRRLAVTRGRAQTDIYLADIDPAGGPLQNPRRLTLDDRGDFEPTWTPDGSTILFSSDRGGKPGIYKQAIDSRIAEAVIAGKEATAWARMSPDGNAILFRSRDSSSTASLMRIPLAGGTPQLVAAMGEGWNGFDCPTVPTAPCISSTAREGQWIFSSFDPLTGTGREVASFGARNPYPNSWALSADGACIAITSEGGDVTLLTLADGGQRKLKLENVFPLQSVSWYPSSEALVVTGVTKEGRFLLLRMDMQGGRQILMERDEWVTDPAPSPDGRRLAYTALTSDTNAWLLEGF